MDYNKCVGLLECYDTRLVDVFDVEEIIEGKRILLARPEDLHCINPGKYRRL